MSDRKLADAGLLPVEAEERLCDLGSSIGIATAPRADHDAHYYVASASCGRSDTGSYSMVNGVCNTEFDFRGTL